MSESISAFMMRELGPDIVKSPATRGELYDIIDQLTEKFAVIRARLDTLEKEGVRFRGVFQRANAYRRGDQVTYKNSLWTALTDVPEGTAPGDNPTHWQLAAKGTG